MRRGTDAGRPRAGALGAVAAQLAQALTSVVLSIAAARALGAEGVGVYGLCYAGIVLATAISTGLVGDSLTVLDRRDDRIRAGLQTVAVSCSVSAGFVAFAVSWAAGLLPVTEAAVFAIGTALFLLEDTLRRLLMASMRFWSVVVVDLSCLVAVAVVLVSCAAATGLSMLHIVGALAVSQAVGAGVAIALLPEVERRVAPWRRASLGPTLRFGAWRAAQQGVRPAMLASMRWLVVAAAGVAAYGTLEAARVYTAPALLVVNGVGGFLFASYAAGRERGVPDLLRRADRGALVMAGAVVGLGGLATVTAGSYAGIVTGGRFAIDPVAVLGWVVYSAGAGLLMPYGSLGAVTGRHVQVFVLRLAESLASLVALGVVLFALEASPRWAPATMAVGPVVLALVFRLYVLGPQARRSRAGESPAPAIEPARSFAGP